MSVVEEEEKKEEKTIIQNLQGNMEQIEDNKH